MASSDVRRWNLNERGGVKDGPSRTISSWSGGIPKDRWICFHCPSIRNRTVGVDVLVAFRVVGLEKCEREDLDNLGTRKASVCWAREMKTKIAVIVRIWRR